MNKAFKIINGRGFHITFRNGYTISVQWGPGNYADNYRARPGSEIRCGAAGSDTAECAVYDKDGLPGFTLRGDSGSYMTAEQVAALMVEVALL